MKISEFYKSHGWTRGAFARSKNKRPVSINSPKAVCFCLLGAVEFCYRSFEEKKVVANLLYERLPILVADWNDEKGRTKKEVVALAKELDI